MVARSSSRGMAGPASRARTAGGTVRRVHRWPGRRRRRRCLVWLVVGFILGGRSWRPRTRAMRLDDADPARQRRALLDAVGVDPSPTGRSRPPLAGAGGPSSSSSTVASVGHCAGRLRPSARLGAYVAHHGPRDARGCDAAIARPRAEVSGSVMPSSTRPAAFATRTVDDRLGEVAPGSRSPRGAPAHPPTQQQASPFNASRPSRRAT